MTKKRRRRDVSGREASDRGFSGEQLIKWWASHERISATKTERDVDGWDITLDVPAPSEPPRPLDLQAPPTIARVQVKTRKRDFKSETIRIRTARVMAMQPVPWFLVCVVMPDRDPVIAYVVHIDESRITEILRAAREARHDRASVKIRWGKAEEVAPEAAAVFGRIREHIGDSRTYAERKSNLSRVVGYGEQAATIKMTVDATPEALEAVVDAGLGLRGSVDVREVALRDERFGIPREIVRAVDTKVEAGGSVPPIGTCILIAKLEDEWAELEFGFFTMFQHFPQELSSRFPSIGKVVLRNQFMDIVLVGNSFQLAPHFPEPFPLRLGAHAARFVRLLYKGATVSGTLKTKDKVVPLELDFAWPELTGAVILPYLAIEAADRLVSLSGTSADHWTSEKHLAKQRQSLLLLASCFGIDGATITHITLPAAPSVASPSLLLGLLSTLDSVSVLFCALVRAHSTGSVTEDGFELAVDSVSIVDRHVTPRDGIDENAARDCLARTNAKQQLQAELITPDELQTLKIRLGRRSQQDTQVEDPKPAETHPASNDSSTSSR